MDSGMWLPSLDGAMGTIERAFEESHKGESLEIQMHQSWEQRNIYCGAARRFSSYYYGRAMRKTYLAIEGLL